MNPSSSDVTPSVSKEERSLSEDFMRLWDIISSEQKQLRMGIEKLQRLVDHMSHRPPHQVECECGRTLEIHCSEETQTLKDHFLSLGKE